MLLVERRVDRRTRILGGGPCIELLRIQGAIGEHNAERRRDDGRADGRNRDPSSHGVAEMRQPPWQATKPVVMSKSWPVLADGRAPAALSKLTTTSVSPP
jgi:hypothetical protein